MWPARIQRRSGLLAALFLSTLLGTSVAARADDFDLPPPEPSAAVEPSATPAIQATPAAGADASPVGATTGQPAVDASQAVVAPAEPATQTADEAFDLRTLALEERVNELKEKILRTKYRLAGLAETVIGGGVTSGAKLALFHRNELGSSYILTSAVYALDGAPLFAKVDETGDLNEREEFVLFDQRIVPGPHQMSVQFELRGHGYGIFSYLEGMRLKLRRSYQFAVEPGKVTRIVTRVKERDGITLEFKDKPDIQFDVSVQKDVVRPADAAAPAQASAEAGAR